MNQHSIANIKASIIACAMALPISACQSESDQSNTNDTTSTDLSVIAAAPMATNSLTGTQSPHGLTSAVPAVLAYLDVIKQLSDESEKERLSRYFVTEAHSADEDESIWMLIESMEQKAHLNASEALTLKLAWLEKTSPNEQSFLEQSQALIDTYGRSEDTPAPVTPSPATGFY